MSANVNTRRKKSSNDKVRFSAEIEPRHRRKFRAIAGLEGISMSEKLRRWIENTDLPRRPEAA